MIELDGLDRRLLDGVQRNLPLSADPFGDLARSLGLRRDEVLGRLERLKGRRVIRQISAIFDTRELGYVSSLVAGRCEPDRLESAAEVINRHPGVSHNYQRDHEFNLWFTIAVPPASRLGLERTVELLGAESGVRAIRLLPALRVFKIGVRFDMTGSERPTEVRGRPADPLDDEMDEPVNPPTVASLTDRQIALIRVLQEDLPLRADPFADWARRAGVSVEELLAAAREFLRQGRMRRLAAVLHHQAAGFAANALGVWVVPAERIEQVGRQMAAFESVSHCYQRPTYPDWPYNLFTMVHARTPEAAQAQLAAIRRATAIDRMAVLFSVREFKKQRVRYFTGQIEAWEAERS